MSNKYFQNWEKNYSQNLSNSVESSKSYEFSHLRLLEKLSNDCARLDRALDKMETEKKANKIFNAGKTQIHNQICFINTGSFYPQPVYMSHIGDKYVVINGCIVILK